MQSSSSTIREASTQHSDREAVITEQNISAFQSVIPTVSNSIMYFSKFTFKLLSTKGSKAYLQPFAVTLILIFIAILPVREAMNYRLLKLN